MRVDNAEDLERADHRQVRDDGAHVAKWGWEAVRDAYAARSEDMSLRLRRECPTEVVLAGWTMPFPAYLATRIVEMLVHADDLVVSVGLRVPSPPAQAVDIALDILVAGARERYGDLAMLRALTRSERGPSRISVF